MDIDVFPNSIEYWGPNGMVFFRNVQLRWTPWSNGDSRFAVALERPGASADQGEYAGRIELEDVKGRFPLPDLSAHFRKAGDCGHVQFSGILRQIKWDDLNDDQFDLSGDATGWGLHISSNLKLAKHVARLSVVYGEGIQNYMNDAPVDVGIQNHFSNPRTPDRRQGPPHARRRRPSSTSTGTRSGRARSAIPCSTSTTPTRQGRAPSRRANTRWPTSCTTPSPTCSWAPSPVGPAGELQRRLQLGRRPHPVLGQVQLQAFAGRQVMTRFEDGSSHGSAAPRRP